MFQVFKLIKPIITNTGPKINKNIKIGNKIKSQKIIENLEINSFGKKNKNKIFYVIKRSPGSGFFSNFAYTLNHLNISKIFNFVPIIDMKNYKTIYNDKFSLINKNAWNYYFKNLNKHKLENVYKSQNVVFSCDNLDKKFYSHLEEINNNKRLKKKYKMIYSKYIKVNKNILAKSDSFFSKYKNFKILGFHLRGTSYKNAPKHPYPIPLSLAIKICDDLLKKKNYQKIFLITEEQKYLDKFKEVFGKKLIFYNSFRSSKNDAFKIYPRKFHRYKLGEEILIETLMLSRCSGIISNITNVSSAAIFLSKKKARVHKVFLGYNSSNKFIASFMWYLKKNLPKYFFGFNFKIE